MRILAVLALSSLFASPALARPGTHGPSVSTWDTRSSSVVFSARETAQLGPISRHLTYNSNFTSTTGRLSTQLGLHYLQYQEEGGTLGHGVSGGAITLYNIPIAGRLDNGLPFIGLGLYFGPAPAAVAGEQFGYVSLPMVAGAGLAISPMEWITISPWFEGAVSVDIDTNVNYTAMDLQREVEADAEDDIEAGEQPDLTADEVRDVVERAVDIDVAVGWSWRVGLSLAIHVWDLFDLGVEGGLGRLGISADEEALAPFASASLVWRWDDVVPAVLPPPPPPPLPPGCEPTTPPELPDLDAPPEEPKPEEGWDDSAPTEPAADTPADTPAADTPPADTPPAGTPPPKSEGAPD